MSSAVPTMNRTLGLIGSWLVALNIIVNIVDLVTTFIGFSRGMSEQNNVPSLLMNALGNKYLVAILLKALFFSLCGLAYFAIKTAQKKNDAQIMDVLGVAFVDLVLVFTGFWILETVVGNFVALGI
jgi:uncharacterized membrane protein